MCITINWYFYGLTLDDFKNFTYGDNGDAIKMHFLTKKNFTAEFSHFFVTICFDIFTEDLSVRKSTIGSERFQNRPILKPTFFWTYSSQF